MKSIASVAVFCGASSGSSRYLALAKQLGVAIAESQRTLVYGGASVGLMGCVADASLEVGGKVIGVIPESLMRHEVAHPRLTELEVVETMQERKLRMMELADGFAVLPGGYGTYDELFEVITFVQLGYLSKPLVLINVDGFYEGLLSQISHAEKEGFIGHAAAKCFGVVDDVLQTLPTLERLSAKG
jgi:hypothetical protein